MSKIKLLLISMMLTLAVRAGLPPTTSKISGDSTNKTTFNYQFPNFTGTHSGITVSLDTLKVSGGGTGSSTVPTNGQIPIGNGSKYVANTLTGTSNQVTVTNGSGTVTLATPQDIATSSSPTFAGETISGDITMTNAQFNSINIGAELAREMSSGVAGGAILTINATTSLWDLTQQTLTFSDQTTLTAPVVKKVICGALTAQTVTGLATQDNTYLLINSSCVITQQSTFPTQAQRRSLAFLGRLSHPSRTFISAAVSLPDLIIDTNSQLYDLFDAVGAFNVSGNVISPNGANLSINKSAGSVFRRSANYATSNQNPHVTSQIAATPVSFLKATQSSVNLTPVTLVDVGSYDVAGTVTAIPGGGATSTNRRIYLFSNGVIGVQYGQVTYTNLANAIAGISTESFVINPTAADGGVLLAVLTCRKDATDLSNTAQCQIIKVGRFDQTGATTGSIATTTLQQAYDNSVTPQITTSVAGGSLDAKRGSTADTDAVFRILNGAGSSTFQITGNGVVSASTYNNKLSAFNATTSAELAGVISDETGTNKLVYSDNAILVAPALGTPVSATLTNATGLPIVGGTIGTLTEIRGGTGQSTYATGDTLYASGTNTLSKLAIGKETNVKRVVGGTVAWAEEDRKNLLVNPNFEDSALTGWTCISGTCTSTNTSGEFAEGLRAYKVALSAQALNASQSVSTVTGISAQGVVGVLYKVPSAITDFQVCTLIAGAEQTCVPSVNLIADNTYHQIEIPVTMTGGSTVGIKFKTTASYTQNVFLDAAYIRQGLGLQNLMLDNMYSAQLSSAAAVSNVNKVGWIASASFSSTGVLDIVPQSGLFGVVPNCTGNINDTSSTTQNDIKFDFANSTISLLRFRTNVGAVATNLASSIHCQKAGNDYSISSASVYSQASSNTEWTAFTPTSPNSSLAFSSSTCYWMRDLSNMLIRCNSIFGTGGTPGNEAQMALPGGVTTVSNLATSTIVGARGLGTNTASSSYVMAKPSVSYINFSAQASAANSQGLSTGTAVSDANQQTFFATIPIQGWTGSSAIVGSFAGYASVNGVSSGADNFIFSYGATATTICSSGTCAYLSQPGSAVSSVAVSGTTYTVTTAKNYSKVYCTIIGISPASTNGVSRVDGQGPGTTFTFSTFNSAGAAATTYGTANCIGIY